jgi:hypothetical protein
MARTVAAYLAEVVVRLDDLRLIPEEENGSARSRREIVAAADVLPRSPGHDTSS